MDTRGHGIEPSSGWSAPRTIETWELLSPWTPSAVTTSRSGSVGWVATERTVGMTSKAAAVSLEKMPGLIASRVRIEVPFSAGWRMETLWRPRGTVRGTRH